MQPSVLRAAWALQHTRAFLPSALQQAATLLTSASLSDDAIASTSTCRTASPASQAPPPSSRSFLHIDSTDALLSALGAARGRRSLSAASGSPSSQSASAGSLATGAYAIEISVQGFEKRYVDMACNTIDDLLMLAFAPKSFSALPVGAPSPDDAPVNIAFGAISRRDVRLPWRRTRFTLLRSPHIDKQGMEQFERREYKTVLTAATNSDTELRRLLEALKIYQFTGVQIRMDVTSAQRVELPEDVRQLLGIAPPAVADAAADGASSGPVLGSPAVTLPAPRSAEELFGEELSAVLRVLRPLVWTGLLARRRALDAVPEFGSWQLRTQQQGQQGQQQPRGAAGRFQAPVGSALLEEDGGASDKAAAGSGGGDPYGTLLRQRLRQQMDLMREQSKSTEAAAAAAYGLDPAVAAELLARIDSELLNAHEAALQGRPQPSEPPSPSEPADASAPSEPGGAAAAPAPPLDASKMSPAEYAYAVLKYVQYVDALYEASGAAARERAADGALQLSAPGLALRLLQLWCAATSVEFKQHLGLPPAEVEKQILEEQLRREEMAKAATALSKGGRDTAQTLPGAGVGPSAGAAPAGGGGTGAAVTGTGQRSSQGPGQGVVSRSGGRGQQQQQGGQHQAGQQQGGGGRRPEGRKEVTAHGGGSSRAGARGGSRSVHVGGRGLRGGLAIGSRGGSAARVWLGRPEPRARRRVCVWHWKT